ncbi:MAG: DNA repair protein RadC [Rhodospirillales bacterium]|nr:DNA repair protein RadC [Rhodospirillales bacterium]
MTEKPDHIGHRKRLRDRFANGGGEALADYELLELCLFEAIPRQDTKPIAKLLLKRFGTYAGVLHAAPDDLRDVKGMGDAAVIALKTVVEAATRLARAEILNQPVLSSWDRLIDYLRIGMGQKKTEQFRILFLDTKNKLIADELHQEGTVNHTPVYPREVVKRALELSAVAIIMVHNHPSGDPTPSRADIDMTKQMRDVGAPMGVTLHDHIIISRSDYSSFKAMGLI